MSGVNWGSCIPAELRFLPSLVSQLFYADGGELWSLHICTVFNVKGLCLCPGKCRESVIPHSIPAKVVGLSCQVAMELLVLCLNRSIPWW